MEPIFPGMDPYLEAPGIWPGFHEAFLSYRSLAAAAEEFPLGSEKVAACVVAYETSHRKAIPLARHYGVHLLSVDRAAVLETALRPGA